MGGKKKKSSAATPTAAPSAATAAGRTGAAAAANGVAEEAKKQPGSNKPAKAAKENKSKGRIRLLSWCLEIQKHRFQHPASDRDVACYSLGAGNVSVICVAAVIQPCCDSLYV